ncbi:MAG: GNAT family N-acetyltransferase [Stappiaceae bacterium]
MKIRPTTSDDIDALKNVLDGTELFPSEMLPDMVQGFLTGETQDELWLTCEVDGTAIGFCYSALETLTDDTWNMLAIAVLPTMQGSGAGGAIVERLEDTLRARGGRILIADTSGTDAFTRTRAFYSNNGYAEEARIRDFWAAGDDKVVYWKSLITSARSA